MQDNTKEKPNDHPKIKREKKPMKAMIKIYYNNHHKTSKKLCD